jgi:NADPH:quinone reductase-like Zn-dependent oxidoreductase
MKTQNFPDHMHAVGVHDQQELLVIKSVPVPAPGKGEVLIKMAASPINPSDLARIRHLNTAEERRIFIAGIEGSGTVVGCGNGLVPSLLMGRRVSCASTHHYSGCWAEYMVTSAMSCIPLPKSVSDEQGSMLLVNPMTAVAFFSIIKKAHHRAIINTAAASSLSRFIDFLGRKHHIPIIHIVRNEDQLKDLRSRGIVHVLNSNEAGFTDRLNALAIHLKATLALDAVGGMLTPSLIRALPFSGSVIIYGNLSGEDPVLDHRSLVNGNKKAEGFYLVNWLKEQSMPGKLSCILKSRTMIKEHITIPVQARFKLDQAEKAVDLYLAHMSAGKVLLIP